MQAMRVYSRRCGHLHFLCTVSVDKKQSCRCDIVHYQDFEGGGRHGKRKVVNKERYVIAILFFVVEIEAENTRHEAFFRRSMRL